MNRFLSFGTLCVFFISSLAPSLSFADPVSVGESQRFMVSAYYSPLPDQKEYVWGSYEADIRMNGQGVRGADFTKVYPGMLAAPKSYPFGTVIQLPGIGIGTVHDRGGAIVERAGYDRIDVWMGWGDDGRVRALQWGMREVTGTIMPAGTADSVQFSVLPASAQKNYSDQNVVDDASPVSLSVGDRGESVTNLQEFLHRGGYLTVEPTGYYGNQTATAVFEFQKQYSIVQSWDSPGAGVFGPKTRAQAEKVWENPQKTIVADSSPVVVSTPSSSSRESNSVQPVTGDQKDGPESYSPDYAVIQPNLQRGDYGDAVTRLQMVLEGKGYYSGLISGVYDEKTASAVLQYQLDNNIVSSSDSRGAGRFGPQTYSFLINELLQNRKQEKIALSDTDFITEEQLAMRRQKIQLAQYDVEYGERSDDVKKLQEELIARGFLEEGFNTGYYGEKTRVALGAYKAYVS